MEEKIYQRQIAKQSLSQRVIDSHQLERHFTDRELRELYAFEPDIYDPEKAEVPIMPCDDLLKYLLSDCKKWILRYHEQDSLLENKLSEGLSEEERKAAWDEYEAEKNNVRRAPIINGLNYLNGESLTPQVMKMINFFK
jgi:transcriptional regulator ATRX